MGQPGSRPPRTELPGMWRCPGIVRWLRCPSWCPFPANAHSKGQLFALVPPCCLPLPPPHAFAPKPSLKSCPWEEGWSLVFLSEQKGLESHPSGPGRTKRSSEVHLPGGWSLPQPELNLTHCQKHPLNLS